MSVILSLTMFLEASFRWQMTFHCCVQINTNVYLYIIDYKTLKNNIPMNWLNENSQFLPIILSLTDGIMGAYTEQGERTVICFKHLL